MPDEDVEVVRGFRPYITRMKEKFGPATETLGASFDEVFVDTRPIALELSSDSLDDTGMTPGCCWSEAWEIRRSTLNISGKQMGISV
jgi:hypothetical protein